jgi:hypothetical protein
MPIIFLLPAVWTMIRWFVPGIRGSPKNRIVPARIGISAYREPG